MGNDNSKYIYELSDDSSESESDYSLEPRQTIFKTSDATLTNNTILQDNDLEIGLCSLCTSNMNIQAVECYCAKDLTTDASANSFNFVKPELVLRVDKVHQIEKDLDDYEIVSLVYLLFDDARYALQELLLLLSGAQKNLIYDWANKENNLRNLWQKKLIEALCIIKNYKVLRDLGYQKQDLNAVFLPERVKGITSLNIVRKAVYLICEKLNEEKTDEFIRNIKRQFLEMNLQFDTYDSEFLELYFLKWETMNYISSTDMTNVKKVLKVMDEEYLYDMLNDVLPPEAPNKKQTVATEHPIYRNEQQGKPLLEKRPSTSTDTQQNAQFHQFSPPFIGQEDYQLSPLCTSQKDSQSSMSQNNDLDNNRYEVDPRYPGILLIINQKFFYRETDPKFKGLLPNDTTINLETREGTEKDQEHLENVFENFGFKVIPKANLKHSDMLTNIEEVVDSIRNESSLFVCIMSHGETGVVYGSNSCKVKVSDIQKIMCKTSRHLRDKPKFLILQLCQGKECQKREDSTDEEMEDKGSHEITTDGPKSVRKSVSNPADMFTFWATVEGYAAIRNKRTGSWFIQTLCEKIREKGNTYHFADICTRIKRTVGNKTWTVEERDKNKMTSEVHTTLTKDFYFPPKRS